MSSFNKVILLGNLTRDVELRALPGGGNVASFGIATNRRWKDSNTGDDREETCFVDVSAFGKQAEVIAQYMQKGKAIMLDGRLRYETWDDKQGGGKRSKLTVVVENFQFVGARQDGNGDGDNGADRDDDDQQQQRSQSAPPQQRPQQGQRPPQNQQRQQSSGGRQRSDDYPF